jgi:hypothetical protein
MRNKILILLLLVSSLFFAGACGTITGNTALDGTTYTSSGSTCLVINIAGAPTNVFIDLHGSTITAAYNNGSGIDIKRNAETSVTIENGTISNSYYAVLLNGISVTLRNVTITHSGYGVYINSSSENNTLANLTINNSDIGIYTLGLNSTITNITITNSTRGIMIDSYNNTLRNITINNTYYSFGVAISSGGVTKSVAALYNNIDNSTLVDGRPIYYIHQTANVVSNLVIGRNLANFGDPAGVFIINGTNILVENITSQFMDKAVVTVWGNNITFNNITVNETFDAVNIRDVHNVTLKDSTIGAYGSGYYDALPRACGGGCSVLGITVAYANNTNITRTKIKDFSYPLACSNSYVVSITNNSVVGYNEVGKAGMQISAVYDSIFNYNNLTYSPWTTRPADTRKTNYTYLAPIVGGTCSGYGCYYTGIALTGNNNTAFGNKVYNTTVGMYTNALYNSTIQDAYIYNSSDGVAFENSINVTLNQSNITNGYFTGYKKVDFRTLGSFNISLFNVTFTTTRISLDFTGNLTVNSSFNLSTNVAVQTGEYTGAAVNITNDSTVSANLTMYYPSGYNGMTVFRYPGNSTTTWINVSDDLGVNHTADYTFGFIRMSNATNFSVYAIFGSKIPTPTPAVPDSGGVPPTTTKSDLSLSINRPCPSGEIIVSSEKGASITIMYPNGWSDSATVGDSGSVSFQQKGEGTIKVFGTHSNYKAVEKTYEYVNCPTPTLSVSSSLSCSNQGSSIVLTVTANRNAIEGANVELNKDDILKQNGITDSSGKITLNLLEAGDYTVVVSKTGYSLYIMPSSYNLCSLSGTWSLKCPEKQLVVDVTANSQPLNEALINYDGSYSSTDTTGKAYFGAINGTASMLITKRGYADYSTTVSLDSPCYTSQPETKPKEKPGEKPGQQTGTQPDTTGGTGSETKPGTTTEKPNGGAGATVEETVKNSLDKLKDAVVELTDTNEKKIAAVVVIVVIGFLAYNYFVARGKPYKPKITKDEN